MKKFIYTMGIIAAAAFTFSSCQKEQTVNEQPSDKLVTITFTADKAGFATKTAAIEGEEEVSFKWTEDDVANIKLFTVEEDSDGKETLTAVANPTVTKVSDTELTISANVAPNATYTFKAILSGKWTNDGKKPRLSDSQSPSATNFDPTADVLISDNMEVTVGASEGESTVSTSALKMVFHRPVVVNKMTLKNMTVGEAIDKVVITSSKDIAGYFYTDSRNASGDKKSITLNYNKEVTVPDGGQFPIYFTTIPGTGHSLTVEVTTDKYVYTKSFAEGKTVDFNLGQFTKFNLALHAGQANTALSLPIEDSMEWAVNGTDATTQLSISDINVSVDGKKVYSDVSYAYKGIDGLKLGTGEFRGLLTTSDLDLTSDYNIAISAKTYGTDPSKVEFLVDGVSVFESDLTSEYKTYYFNASSATSKSRVSIKINGKRGYIKDLTIKTGNYVAPPAINVISDNPMDVPNTKGSSEITYTIDNSSQGVSIQASSNVEWIHDFVFTTLGKVSFTIDAQAEGASSRSGEITLFYTGAKSVIVTINQAAGEGGTTSYSYSFTSKEWESEPEGWTSDKDATSLEAAKGVSIQKAASGAGATSDATFSSISKITITLSKSNKGAGSVDVKVGDETIGRISSFNTDPTDYSFDVSNISGKVSFVVNCTTSTIYVKGISITARGSN